MTDAQRWPIDFDELEKGSTIGPEVIEKAFNVERGSREYRLKVMALREDIEEHFTGRGILVWVKSEGDSLIVLTDEAAQPYLDNLGDSLLRRFGKVQLVNRGLDPTQMTEDTRRAHESSVVRNSRLLQALHAERLKLKKEGFHMPRIQAPPEEESDDR